MGRDALTTVDISTMTTSADVKKYMRKAVTEYRVLEDFICRVPTKDMFEKGTVEEAELGSPYHLPAGIWIPSIAALIEDQRKSDTQSLRNLAWKCRELTYAQGRVVYANKKPDNTIAWTVVWWRYNDDDRPGNCSMDQLEIDGRWMACFECNLKSHSTLPIWYPNHLISICSTSVK